MDIITMKEEAIRRLKAMNVDHGLIDELQKDFKIKCTNNLTGHVGDINELEQEVLDEFNSLDYGFPYYMIVGFEAGNYLMSILYVEKDDEEWEFECECIENGYPHAYVYNFGRPDYSEIGTILIKTYNGVLHKIG